MSDTLEKEKMQITEIILIATQLDKQGLMLLNSQAQAIATYEKLLKQNENNSQMALAIK